MDVLKSVATQLPMILASLVFVVAVVFKTGKEKGAILVLLGAIGLFLMSIVSPIIYSGIMPKLIENGGVDDIEVIYRTVGLMLDMLWASTIILIAIGTFLRPTVHSPADLLQQPPY